MKDNGDFLLENVKPQGAPPELRERVLSAVAQELSTGIVPSWENRIGWLVAAAAVLGVVLNLWAVRTNERRLEDLAGPHPAPQKVSEMVEIAESVTGRGTGGWVQQRLVEAWRSRSVPPPQRMPDWEQLSNDLEINGKVYPREKVQEVPQKRHDRAGLDHRDSFDHQCRFHLHTRQIA